jgi:hypothetical protein
LAWHRTTVIRTLSKQPCKSFWSGRKEREKEELTQALKTVLGKKFQM